MPHFPFERRHVDRIETARVVSRRAFAHGLAGIVLAVTWGAGLAAADDGANTVAVGGNSFPPAAVEFFEARVRPILVDQCVKCHGPKKQSSGLRLDSREAMLKGGDSGPAVVPSKPDESLLIQAVGHTHAELKMPPSGKLPEPALAILRQWVSLGAPWSVGAAKGMPEFGASTCDPPTRPLTGLFSRSGMRLRRAVKDREWLRTPLDAFVLARLEAAGLAPSREADKRTLIRRATMDLWGIPRRPMRLTRLSRTGHPTPLTGWLIVCWLRHGMASAGAGTGWTSPATPTPRVTSLRRIDATPMPILTAIT